MSTQWKQTMPDDVAAFVDAEELTAPITDVVQLHAVLNRPPTHAGSSREPRFYLGAPIWKAPDTTSPKPVVKRPGTEGTVPPVEGARTARSSITV